MAATTAHRVNFVNEVRADAKAFVDAYAKLIAKQAEWNALDYGSNLAAGGGVFAGNHEGLTSGNVGAVIFDTMAEVKLRIFDTGHATNLFTVLP